MAERLEALDAANREAWLRFRQTVTRFTYDTHTVPLVLERMTRDLSEDELTDLMERFAVLYDALYPPPEPPKGTT